MFCLIFHTLHFTVRCGEASPHGLPLGWLSIDAVLGRTAGLKNGVQFPRTILQPSRAAPNRVNGKPALRAATNESQKTLNKCETRNRTVFHTRLRHPETINSVQLNSVLRIKQIGV